MSTITGNHAQVVRCVRLLLQALLTGGPASVTKARADLTAALVVYDA